VGTRGRSLENWHFRERSAEDLGALHVVYYTQLRASGGGNTASRRGETTAVRSERLCRRLTDACHTAKQRPVCASDGLTYASKCEIRRLRRCERRLIAVVSSGHCPVGKAKSAFTRSLLCALRYVALRRWGLSYSK